MANLTAERQERDPLWLRQLREDAWQRFHAKGFPTTHDEDWRFTNLAALAKTPFQRAAKGSVAVTAAQIENFRVPGAGCRLVFVNGHFAPELSEISDLPKGLEICSLERPSTRHGRQRAEALRVPTASSSTLAAMPTCAATSLPR